MPLIINYQQAELGGFRGLLFVTSRLRGSLLRVRAQNREPTTPEKNARESKKPLTIQLPTFTFIIQKGGNQRHG